MRSILSISIILVVLVIALVPVQAHADNTMTLSPNVKGIKILRGTPGSDIGTIRWSGTEDVGKQWVSCKLSIPTPSEYSGLKPYVYKKYCGHGSGNKVDVYIDFKFKGTYTGGSFDLTPVSGITLKLYDVNNTLVSEINVDLRPVPVKEVEIQDVHLGSPPIESSSISYVVFPKDTDKRVVGRTIYIYTSGQVNIEIQLSDTLTVPATIDFQYQVPSEEGSNNVETTRISFSTNELQHTFTIPDVPLISTLPYVIYYNKLNLYSGNLDLTEIVKEYNMGGAMFTAGMPYLVWANESDWMVFGDIYVNEIKGSLDVTLKLDQVNKSSEVVTITEPGTTTIKIKVGKELDHISGQYNVKFTGGGYNSPPEFSIKFDTAFTSNVGNVLGTVFYILFLFMFVAGFFSVFIGVILRRPDLQTSGITAMLGSTLIFFIPTVMGYSILVLTHAGVVDPIGLSDLTITNIGEKVDKSIRYIQLTTHFYSTTIYNIVSYFVTLLAGLGGASVIGGLVGLITGGGLSQFIGKVLGEYGSVIIKYTTLAIITATFLQILGAIFPILIDLILVIMLFIAILQAIFASVTGNIAPVFSTVIGMSVIILSILVTPLVLATMNNIKWKQHIEIVIPKVKTFEVPNIFAWIGMAVIEMVFLTAILGLAFQKLMAVLSGMGG